ncbi:MAG: YicC/YloC family endoribonuclease [Pseudomonadota bacterium]
MTAFARERYQGSEGELLWELRSVNHRYLEIYLRLPEELRGLEGRIRDRLGQRLKRGKLDGSLRFRPEVGEVPPLEINGSLVTQLLDAVKTLGAATGRRDVPSPWELLRWPGVVREPEQNLNAAQTQVMVLLDHAIDTLVETRGREGERMASLIHQRAVTLREQVILVRARMPQVLGELRTRLLTRLGELSAGFDAARLEQEMVLLAQRLDVDEELDRLIAHLDEMEAVLERNEPAGRRLDFLMQELNRETNTLTSKTSDIEVTRRAVEMKVVIEQIREQVQNLE